jgi:hypothetical protein
VRILPLSGAEHGCYRLNVSAFNAETVDALAGLTP